MTTKLFMMNNDYKHILNNIIQTYHELNDLKKFKIYTENYLDSSNISINIFKNILDYSKSAYFIKEDIYNILYNLFDMKNN